MSPDLPTRSRPRRDAARRPDRTRRRGAGTWLLAVLGVLALAHVRPVAADMDIEDNGPVLDAGRFTMRITNVGILGNAFFNKGLSFDPSLEFPKGSGQECLEHAEFWVGATREDGSIGVSGGPMLEWRPTLDPKDRVAVRYAGDRGTRSSYDDDGDGKLDEEFLDGADDDGDGEVDEDVRFPAQQTAACRYTDDQPAAIEYGYENGERHVPLGLTVKQEAHTWSLPGFDRIAAVHFTVTNHGRERLRDVRLGVYANLDARSRSGGAGHLDDAVTRMTDTSVVHDGVTVLRNVFVKDCFTTLAGDWAAMHDANPNSTAPWSALVGVSHTTDPLGYVVNFAYRGAREAQAAARAPRRDTAFTTSVFSPSLPPRQGGPPGLDADRYAALRGQYATAPLDEARDYAVLLSSGPFGPLDPGQSVELAVAFLVAESADSLVSAAQSARLAWRGTRLDLLPNRTPGSNGVAWLVGETYINGHESCIEVPRDLEFVYDPHCTAKFYLDPAYIPPPALPPETIAESTFVAGKPCIWADMDCDVCTGWGGQESVVRWSVRTPGPPQPQFRSVAGDRVVTVEWDNLPELLANASVLPGPPWTFWGYRIYRLDQWDRESLLPAASRWQQVASFAVDTSLGARPLSEVLDPLVESDSIAYEQPYHPVGRYKFRDPRVLDGFDYHYVVTAVAWRKTVVSGSETFEFLESPFRALFGGIVRPRIEAASSSGGTQVWVVPNPYRQDAPWEREPVPGDAFTRHVDFFGLPRANSRIRIYTLAGDLVQTLEHDGTLGNGQAPWNLISRNGQDVQSGVYLFTVTWPEGHQVGRFVLIR